MGISESASTRTSKNYRYAVLALALVAIVLGGTSLYYFNALSNANNQKTELAGNLDTSSTKIDSLNTQISGLQSQITTLSGQNSNLQSQVATLTGQITTLQGQIDSLTASIHQLQLPHVMALVDFTQVASTPGHCIPIFGCIPGTAGSATATTVTFANTGTTQAADVQITVSFYASSDASGTALCSTSSIDLGKIGGQAIIRIDVSSMTSATCTWPASPVGGTSVSAMSYAITKTVAS